MSSGHRLVDLAGLPAWQREVVLANALTWWPELVAYVFGSQVDPNYGNHTGRHIPHLWISIAHDVLEQPEPIAQPAQLRRVK